MEQNQTERSQQAVQLKNETWRLTLQTFINLVIATMISIVLVLSLSSLMSSVWGKLVTEAVCLAFTAICGDRGTGMQTLSSSAGWSRIL